MRNVWLSLLLAALFTGGSASAAELTGIAHVSVGRLHSCALATAGDVKCWGFGSAGQLGDGSLAYRATLVDVVGLEGGAAAIDAGGYHTCAVTLTGAVRCWGENGDGQLGDGTRTPRPRPGAVQGLQGGMVGVTGGYSHSCALSARGAVKCWGGNTQGQLGDGTQSMNRLLPVDVVGLQSGVVAVAAGDAHTCAVLADGAVKCWGNNDYGQLGNNARLGSTVPVTALAAGSGATAISVGGSHTCVLTAQAVARCWGSNNFGQLGDGTTTDRLSAVTVMRLESGAKSISAGLSHTCAVTTAGASFCWGANARLQLGSFLSAPGLPFQVLNQTGGVASIAAGANHTCEVTIDGHVKCWGEGQLLGNGGGGMRPVPVGAITLGSGMASVSAGVRHSCALKSDGLAFCWGDNFSGQLGDATPLPSIYPVPVRQGTVRYTALAAGGLHTCGLAAGGRVQCWGANAAGQLGDGTGQGGPIGFPVDVVALPNSVTAIAAGDGHACALDSVGEVRCWGSNSLGQLGDGTMTTRLAPVLVSGVTGAIAIGVGRSHGCAVLADGAVKCWGANNQGQIGDGTLTHRPLPQRVVDRGIRNVTAGTEHTCVLKDDGGVRCWGSDSSGQLGSGRLMSGANDVVGLPGGVLRITAGGFHTCAITVRSRVKCWGSNVAGQVGNFTQITVPPVPIDVLGLESGVLSLSAGGLHTCAVTPQSAVKCWGSDLQGQLGDGYADRVAPPVAVIVPDRPPVVEFYNATLDHYFVTAGAGEAQAIDRGDAGPGWSRTGLTFKSGGEVPVCRFYGSAAPGPNSHFYAVDGRECEELRDVEFAPGDPRRGSLKSWNFEGFAFSMMKNVGETCPSGTIPVYRAYNNKAAIGGDANHRLATNRGAIAEVVGRGWIDEGVVMCAPD